MATIGEKIKEVRKEYGLTQKELSEILGVSVTSIGYYESGRNKPSKNTVFRLASALNIRLSSLISDDLIFTDEDAELMNRCIYEREENNRLYKQHYLNSLSGDRKVIEIFLDELNEDGLQLVRTFLEFILEKKRELIFDLSDPESDPEE